jgi:hypothetical protein
MAAAVDGGRWARVLELGGEKRVAGGAVGEVAGVPVPFIGPEAVREVVDRELGRRPLMAPFRVGEEMGRVVATIHFATGGEEVLRGGGEQAAVAANREGGSGLAFSRRKEKREQASAGPKGGGVGLDWPASQGPGMGKAAQEEGRGDGPGEGEAQREGRRERAGWGNEAQFRSGLTRLAGPK